MQAFPEYQIYTPIMVSVSSLTDKNNDLITKKLDDAISIYCGSTNEYQGKLFLDINYPGFWNKKVVDNICNTIGLYLALMKKSQIKSEELNLTLTYQQSQKNTNLFVQFSKAQTYYDPNMKKNIFCYGMHRSDISLLSILLYRQDLKSGIAFKNKSYMLSRDWDVTGDNNYATKMQKLDELYKHSTDAMNPLQANIEFLKNCQDPLAMVKGYYAYVNDQGKINVNCILNIMSRVLNDNSYPSETSQMYNIELLSNILTNWKGFISHFNDKDLTEAYRFAVKNQTFLYTSGANEGKYTQQLISKYLEYNSKIYNTYIIANHSFVQFTSPGNHVKDHTIYDLDFQKILLVNIDDKRYDTQYLATLSKKNLLKLDSITNTIYLLNKDLLSDSNIQISKDHILKYTQAFSNFSRQDQLFIYAGIEYLISNKLEFNHNPNQLIDNKLQNDNDNNHMPLYHDDHDIKAYQLKIEKSNNLSSKSNIQKIDMLDEVMQKKQTQQNKCESKQKNIQMNKILLCHDDNNISFPLKIESKADKATGKILKHINRIHIDFNDMQENIKGEQYTFIKSLQQEQNPKICLSKKISLFKEKAVKKQCKLIQNKIQDSKRQLDKVEQSVSTTMDTLSSSSGSSFKNKNILLKSIFNSLTIEDMMNVKVKQEKMQSLYEALANQCSKK